MKVEEYLKVDGTSPYQDWFNSLESQAAAKVSVAIYRMEQGLISSVKWFEGIGEYKIDWGPGLRIYLAKDGEDLIILFGGGTKKSQDSDILKAKSLFQEYKDRKKAAKSSSEKKKRN